MVSVSESPSDSKDSNSASQSSSSRRLVPDLIQVHSCISDKPVQELSSSAMASIIIFSAIFRNKFLLAIAVPKATNGNRKKKKKKKKKETFE
jgi:hypothetical protein